MGPHLKHWVQFAPQYKENINILEQGQWKAVKTIRVLENKTYKERLIKMGLFGFRKEGREEILLLSVSIQSEGMETAEPDSSWKCMVMG